MTINLSARFAFDLEQPASVLMQFEAADIPEQELISVSSRINPSDSIARVAAQDDIGERIWLHADSRVEVEYEACVKVTREVHDLASLDAMKPHHLPGQAVKFLFSSRY